MPGSDGDSNLYSRLFLIVLLGHEPGIDFFQEANTGNRMELLRITHD